MNDKANIISRINNADNPLYCRWGFGWKGAEWHKTNKENLISVL